MLLHTESMAAIKCPECGKPNFGSFSLFSIKKFPFKLHCECGTELLTIGTRDKHHFWLDYECYLCEDRHYAFLGRSQLFGQKAEPFFCEEIGIAVGYVGPEQKVKKAIKLHDRSLEEMAKELGFNDYFINPQVMYRILEHLYNLAEQGELTCSCGSRSIEIEIYPDYLELKCEKCSAGRTIVGENERDLEVLNTKHLEIIPLKLYPINGNR